MERLKLPDEGGGVGPIAGGDGGDSGCDEVAEVDGVAEDGVLTEEGPSVALELDLVRDGPAVMVSR